MAGSSATSRSFAAAVVALHSPSSSAADRSQANEWLIAFSCDASAGDVCEAALLSHAADVNQQVFAAAILTKQQQVAVSRLLELCAPPACVQAVSGLACAIADATTIARAEDSLLAAAGFITLSAQRQTILLQALAESLAQQASAEELRARPSVVAACAAAVRPAGALIDHLPPPVEPQLRQAPTPHAPHQPGASAGSAVDPRAALACLSSWASCGVLDFTTLAESFPALFGALHSALDPHALMADASGLRLTGAARSAEVFRACLQCTLDADESLEAATCAPLVAVLGRWCHVGGGAFSLRSLGAPTIDASSGLSDGGGPYAESCGELAANLAGMAALILELLVDDVDAFLASPASESERRLRSMPSWHAVITPSASPQRCCRMAVPPGGAAARRRR